MCVLGYNCIAANDMLITEAQPSVMELMQSLIALQLMTCSSLKLSLVLWNSCNHNCIAANDMLITEAQPSVMELMQS